MASNPNLGRAPNVCKQNIIENVVNSKHHTTLVAAPKAAGLVEKLVAPTNEPFAKLPQVSG